MARSFLSDRLDLSRIRSVRPEILLDLNFDAILAARLADFRARWPEWEMGALETDPVVFLQQADAYRELLDKQAMNEAYRAVLPAFATGGNLDQIAARAGVYRLVLGEGDNGEPIREDDDTLRLRYFASFGAPSAGSEDAYVFAAVTAYPEVRDVSIVGPTGHGEPGHIDVVLLAENAAPIPEERILAVHRAVNGRRVRPLTDDVSTQAAEIVRYRVNLWAKLPRGPDPIAAKAEIEANLARIVGERFRVGGEVPVSAIEAAAYAVGALDAVASLPAADIPPDPFTAPFCEQIEVSVETVI